MYASDLLAKLETMMKEGIPLHRLIVRVEVSDSYYDRNIVEDDVYEETYDERRYLIIHGD